MKKSIGIGFLLILLAILIAAIFSGYFLNKFYIQKAAKDAPMVYFEIVPGDSVKKISSNLKEKEIIESTFAFEVYVWLFGLDGVFQPGEYTFKSGQSISRLVNDMTTVNIEEVALTIIEGWTLRDLANYLLEKDLINNEDELYYLTGRPAVDYRDEKVDFKGGWTYDFLSDKPAHVSLEGYIYPDTYRILREAGVEGLLKKAFKNFDEKLTPELRAEIKRQGKGIFEVITIASIVEKEVNTYKDRKIVADIIKRRLARGMALQMDSTVNYAINANRSRSTYKDLESTSPWNTYKYSGLPLGPINNPSIWAIQAVIYPQPNQYFYFLTDPAGKVYYGKTYAEHLANRKYLD